MELWPSAEEGDEGFWECGACAAIWVAWWGGEPSGIARTVPARVGHAPSGRRASDCPLDGTAMVERAVSRLGARRRALPDLPRPVRAARAGGRAGRLPRAHPRRRAGADRVGVLARPLLARFHQMSPAPPSLDFVRKTPLVFAPPLNCWLKLESLQATGSFKLRGAALKLSRMDADGARARRGHRVGRQSRAGPRARRRAPRHLRHRRRLDALPSHQARRHRALGRRGHRRRRALRRSRTSTR